MTAIEELFCTIAEHAIYRSHATINLAARKECYETVEENRRLKSFAIGRGMVSEADNWEEIAVLVCGLHDRIDRIKAAYNNAMDEVRELTQTELPD